MDASAVLKLVDSLSTADPTLDALRREHEATASVSMDDNVLRHDHLMTRATKG